MSCSHLNSPGCLGLVDPLPTWLIHGSLMVHMWAPFHTGLSTGLYECLQNTNTAFPQGAVQKTNTTVAIGSVTQPWKSHNFTLVIFYC